MLYVRSDFLSAPLRLCARKDEDRMSSDMNFPSEQKFRGGGWHSRRVLFRIGAVRRLLILLLLAAPAAPRAREAAPALGPPLWQRLVSGEFKPGDVCRVELDAGAARDCAGLPDGVFLRDTNGIWHPYHVVATATSTNLLFEAGMAGTLILEGREGRPPPPPRAVMRVAPEDALRLALGPRLDPGAKTVKKAVVSMSLQAVMVISLLILCIIVTRIAFKRYAQ